MIEYIPIITSVFAVFFFLKIYDHYRQKPGVQYLFWWMVGVATFGIGSLTESINVVFGWNLINFKSWYIAGALLGGFPLAQGTVYLLMNQRFARISSIIVVSVICLASIPIIFSPVDLPANFDGGLTGSVFTWKWVRYFSPLINLYAFVFLFGGAVYSAIMYARKGRGNTRFVGNILIAIGALLPGIGGSFTRMGHVEVLFVTELIGLLFIYAGYAVMLTDRQISLHINQRIINSE
jgi:hypothetical protein